MEVTFDFMTVVSFLLGAWVGSILYQAHKALINYNKQFQRMSTERR